MGGLGGLGVGGGRTPPPQTHFVLLGQRLQIGPSVPFSDVTAPSPPPRQPPQRGLAVTLGVQRPLGIRRARLPKRKPTYGKKHLGVSVFFLLGGGTH